MRSLIALASLALLGAAPASELRAKASLDDLSWLAGEWTGEGAGLVLHENYSAPVGGQIAAHFSGAKNGKPQFYEFETIAQDGDSLDGLTIRRTGPDTAEHIVTVKNGNGPPRTRCCATAAFRANVPLLPENLRRHKPPLYALALGPVAIGFGSA